MADPTWKTLPNGCGGLITGFSIAADGKVICRSDVGGLYGFTGTIAQITDPTKKWVQLMTNASLKDSAGTGNYAPPGGATTSYGAYEAIVAPSNSSYLYAWLPKNNVATDLWRSGFYYSSDFGAHWTQATLYDYVADGGSNGTWRRAQGIIAVDPNNHLVVYAGMRSNSANGSGSAAGCFFAVDGHTFNAVTTNGSTALPAVTSDPGCYGMAFDPNYTGGTTTTTTAHGVTCTKRLLIPIGGTDVYETLDGGATFTATGLATAAGRSDVAVIQGKMDYDGVYYCLVAYAGASGLSAFAHIWRYGGAAARGTAAGTGWVEIGAATGFPSSGSYNKSIQVSNACVIVVDPRNGHQGFVSVFGPNGLGNGFTSTNANLATANSIGWSGGSGGGKMRLRAPSYDVPYMNSINSSGGTSFVDCPDMQIDQNGNFWWCGNQGALWLVTQSDLTTPASLVYNAASMPDLYSVSTSRGAEAVVSQEVIRPPGGTYPVVAMQDVGVHQSYFTQGQYATDWFPSPSRSDATSLCYAPNNPAHVAVRCCQEGHTPVNTGVSGYSTNYGETGSWVQYATQPDPACATVFTGSQDGAGVLTVTSVTSGNILYGTEIYLGSSFGTDTSVYVTSQLTNTNASSIPYREGTYQLSANGTARTSQTMSGYNMSVGGQVIVLDEDHHMVVPFSSGLPGITGGGAGQPIIVTSQARHATDCNWQISYGLPLWNWTRRGYASGTAAKPLAADQVTAGTAYAAQCEATASHVQFWKTTDYGATWSQTGSISFGASGNYGSPNLLPVRGHAGHLFFTAQFTSGSNTGLWFSDDGGATWTSVNLPATYTWPQRFAIGGSYAGYPKLYYQGSTGSALKIFSSIFDPAVKTANWQTLGATGTFADHAPSCQLTGITTLNADPVVNDLLYVSSGSAGFEYFGDNQVAVHFKI